MSRSDSKPRDVKKDDSEPIVSLRARDGSMIEAIVSETGQSRLVVARQGEWRQEAAVVFDGRRYMRYIDRPVALFVPATPPRQVLEQIGLAASLST